MPSVTASNLYLLFLTKNIIVSKSMFTKQLKRELIHSFTAGALSREYLRDLRQFAPSAQTCAHLFGSCCVVPLVPLGKHLAKFCSCCSHTRSVQTRFRDFGDFALLAPDRWCVTATSLSPSSITRYRESLSPSRIWILPRGFAFVITSELLVRSVGIVCFRNIIVVSSFIKSVTVFLDKPQSEQQFPPKASC
jgi:hypothetical protein